MRSLKDDENGIIGWFLGLFAATLMITWIISLIWGLIAFVGVLFLVISIYMLIMHGWDFRFYIPLIVGFILIAISLVYGFDVLYFEHPIQLALEAV